jgi:hypothetical protein
MNEGTAKRAVARERAFDALYEAAELLEHNLVPLRRQRHQTLL